MAHKNTANIHKIVMNQCYNKKLEEKRNINRRTLEEKGYSSELNLRGMKSYFEEKWGIQDAQSGELIKVPLEEQNLPVVGPFEDIRETESFQIGRKRGEFLVNHGYTQEIYLNSFLPEFESKFGASKKHR